ncbi:MAG TPA: hypothetical protein VHM19_08045, partial [Polyangiales bacterium]|nr:hypothetical protein [Polyangiales bacterium]
LREAGERGDPLTAGRIRHLLAVSSLATDDVTGAFTLLDQASGGLHARSTLSALTESLSRSCVHLYRGDVDACAETYEAFDKAFGTALASVPFWRSILVLMRARSALLVDAGAGGDAKWLAHAARAVADVEKIGLPCFADDARMLRACLAVSRQQPSAALAELEPLVRSLLATSDSRHATLIALFAQRAYGQLVGGAEGQHHVSRAEAWIGQRGIVHARRFARLFLPGLEERARALVPPVT